MTFISHGIPSHMSVGCSDIRIVPANFTASAFKASISAISAPTSSINFFPFKIWNSSAALAPLRLGGERRRVSQSGVARSDPGVPGQ